MENTSDALHLLGRGISRRSFVRFLIADRLAAIIIPFITATARAIFDEFDFMHNTISSTCQPSNNPLAVYICPLNFALLAPLAVLFVKHVHEKLGPLLPRARWIVSLLMCIGSLGYSVSMLINLDMNKTIHTIAAFVAIACFSIGLLVAGFALFEHIMWYPSTRWKARTSVQFAVICPAFVAITFLVIGTQAASALAGAYPAEESFLSFPLWEWITFVALNAMIIATGILDTGASMPATQVDLHAARLARLRRGWGAVTILAGALAALAGIVLLSQAARVHGPSLWDWDSQWIAGEKFEKYPPWEGPAIVLLVYAGLFIVTFKFVTMAKPGLVTSPRVVKGVTVGGFLFYIALLVIGVAVAVSTSDYLPFERSISSMATTRYSSAPWIYDIACVVAGIGLIPLLCSIKQMFGRDRTGHPGMAPSAVMAAIAFYSGMVGSFCYPLVGIWSSGRDLYNELHSLATMLTFLGFIVAALFTGLAFVIGNIGPASTLAGLIGVVAVPSFFVIYMTVDENYTEWLLLFSLLAWVLLSATTVARRDAR
ncbi:MAG: hypothetical protein JW839_16195 [Candidatus Lokiarchaeota archaeon]|nr:hypothetical protein [Candidatus Lokiarchaeota archaeon]